MQPEEIRELLARAKTEPVAMTSSKHWDLFHAICKHKLHIAIYEQHNGYTYNDSYIALK